MLKQYSDLGPRRLRGLTWLNENTYAMKEGKGEEEKLIAFDLSKNKETVKWTPGSLTSALKADAVEVKSLPAFDKLGTNLFTFSINGAYYLWDVKSGKVKGYKNDVEGISDVHFSNGGDYMTYVKGENIYLKPLAGESKQVTVDGNRDLVYGKAVSRFEFGISEGIFWSPGDEPAFAYYRNDQSEVSDYPLVDLTKTPAGSDLIKYPMAGGKSEKISVELYYAKTGKTVKIQTDESEDTYICTINWAPDGNSVVLVTLNRDQNHMQFKAYNAMTGSFIGRLYEEKDDKYVEPLYPLVFTSDNSTEFIYMSQKNGFMHAYLRKNGEEKQLTSGNFPLTGILGMNQDKSLMFFEGTGENPTESQIFRLSLTDGTFERISHNNGVYHGVLSDNGAYFITYFSSIDVPGKVVIADNKGNVLKQLLSAPDPLEEYDISRPELLNITNEKGTVLHARMIKPHDFDESKKYPVLVYVYGGPHAQLVQNRWWGSAPLWMNYMAEKGYLVFTVDGRGSYNRGKEFEQAVFRNLSELEMDDQLAGVAYLKSLKYVDENRMAVHGWSYGGFMTTSLMLKKPGVFKVGVAGGP
ncbi:MAG TPA: S9 family peptidase, partial [Flavobacteriales bacterium]|nr:S9 family peptidase [Flavobacteriales bacterium]